LYCDGECCPEGHKCCDGKTCYDPATKKCCNYGTGQICDKNKQCCDGSCCDPATECCVDGECKPKCIPDGGEMCSYELPSHIYQDVCYFQPGNWLCDPEGTDCGFKVTNGPHKNAICQPGCSCGLGSTWCVLYRVAKCQNTWVWLPPFFMCQCQPDPFAGGDMQGGSRDVCP